MPLHSYVVLSLFALLGAVLVFRMAVLKHGRLEIVGKPPIDLYYFYSGKITLVITWILFIVKALVPKLGYLTFPSYVSWIAAGMLCIGAMIAGTAIVQLGRSLMIGLPETDTMLKTTGIYRISRNPLYTGLYIISIASGIYFPDLINISFAIYGIYIHHRIVKGEEIFLSRRFGREWDEYKARVRRYLI